MNYTIKMKLLTFGAVSILLALGVGISGFTGIINVDKAMDEIVVNSSGLGNHLTADMMHDALRSDVLAALLASGENNQSEQKAIQADLKDHADLFRAKLKENESLPLSENIKQRLASTKPALSAYIRTSEDIVKLAFEDRNKAMAQMEAFKISFDKLAIEMEALSELIENSTAQAQENGDSSVVLSKNLIMIISLVAAALLVAISMFVAGRITKPINLAVVEAEKISNGDLTGQIEITSRDETGQLLNALNMMKSKLLAIVSTVRESTDEVTLAASEISKGNLDLSQRTEEQASSLEETASSMEEMTSTVKQNADNAGQANQLAMNTREQAELGGQVVHEAIEAMAEINKSSSRISEIISVVEEIAFQTNLLALNAAVEAARAGEQGRGFAVVATEVRSLAQRSSESSKEVKVLIEDSVMKVKKGSDLVDKSGQTLEEIVEGVKKVTDIVSEITASSREQATGIDQVNKAVMQMDEVTQQNAALVEEAASASRSMELQAQNLNEQMSFFKVDQSSSRSNKSSSQSVQEEKAGTVHTLKPKPQITAQRSVTRTGTHDDEWDEF
ncbi:MAG: methyl-accepting chemotaxis protein [Gammaproteobacteria bacterium]|nr:methyl-accepting chemotaxis protein [Gammaproteobacteria bacterium]